MERKFVSLPASTSVIFLTGSFDIVCFSISRTDSGISSPGFSLARQFARSHRVFYIEHPFTYKDLFAGWNTPGVVARKEVWFGNKPWFKNDPSGVTVITPPLTWPVNFLSNNFLYNLGSTANDEKLIGLLRTIKKEFNIDQFLFINFFDPFYFRHFPADIKPFMTVYQCMDDIAEVPYTARHGVRREKEWIQNATFSICTSTGLMPQHAAGTGRIHLLPNGVDETIFGIDLQYPVPVEFRNIISSIVGYIGSIEYRMDIQLMIAAAEALPHYQFCFVGPVGDAGGDLQHLMALPNVLFTGPKAQADLPAFLQHCSAVCIPFKCNKLTANIYPLKVNEYLMAGKPVVSTAFSPDIISFIPDVYIAQSKEEFIRLIQVAVTEPPGKESHRKARAAGNTWEIRAKEFFQLVNQYAGDSKNI